MNDTIDIVKALLELDFICIDVDKKDTYIYKMLNDLILFIEKVSKVEELLGLYRKHINTLCKKDREGVKNSLFSSEHLAYELYEKIKTLEEELK